MPTSPTLKAPPKIMLGFVVRQCAVALGRTPTAEEFREWANDRRLGSERYNLFGRPITLEEARVILRNPGRPVTVRDAASSPLFEFAALDECAALEGCAEDGAGATAPGAPGASGPPSGSERPRLRLV